LDDEFIGRDDKIRAELRRQYVIELGDVQLTPEIESEMNESIELNLFLAKESESLNYSKSFENQIG
jgi:hypothetical protein